MRVYNRQSGHRTRGAGVVEEDPFPRARAQSVHVRDDHHIVRFRPVHGTAGIRFQEDRDDTRETVVVAVVVVKRGPPRFQRKRLLSLHT